MVTKDCCAAATWHWGSTGLLQILATDCDAHFQVFDSEHEHEHEYERSTSTSGARARARFRLAIVGRWGTIFLPGIVTLTLSNG